MLSELPDAEVKKSIHSTSGRFLITQGQTQLQVEFNVSPDVPSEPLTTELLAKKAKVLPQVIRVMSKEVALAHKMAAWNERRLARDLYDIYYWHAHVGVLPDMAILTSRLEQIQSRLQKLKNRKRMSLEEFQSELRNEIQSLDEKKFSAQLRPLLPPQRLEGLVPVLKSKLSELTSLLSG